VIQNCSSSSKLFPAVTRWVSMNHGQEIDSEKRIRVATKPGAKQIHCTSSEFFGSQSPFWLLFGLAKSNIIVRKSSEKGVFGYFLG